MTYLPSPAEATAAAQRLYAKTVAQSRSKTSSRHSQASSPARKRGWAGPALLGSAAALGAAALYTNKMTRDAERETPPIGRFLEVDGVRLHYIEQGQGEPLVLIHGNGPLIQDFTINGLVDRLSKRYRVIVIERPGLRLQRAPAPSV